MEEPKDLNEWSDERAPYSTGFGTIAHEFARYAKELKIERKQGARRERRLVEDFQALEEQSTRRRRKNEELEARIEKAKSCFFDESKTLDERALAMLDALHGLCEECTHTMHLPGKCNFLYIYDRGPNSPPGNRRCLCGYIVEFSEIESNV